MKRSWIVLVGIVALRSAAYAGPVPNWDRINFWASTSVYGNTANAYVVGLGGSVGLSPKTDTFARGIWCVRGGHSTEGQ